MKFLVKTLSFWLFSYTLGFAASQALPLEKLKLPNGFKVSIYAEGLDGPRQMALADGGIVFVGTKTGEVYALEPSADSKHAKKVDVIAEKLSYPNGVAFRDGVLYVGEIQQISKYEDILNHLQAPPERKIISTALPDKTWHGFRYIKFGPDGWLYMGIGMPCNSCLQDDKRFGTIGRISLDNPQKLEIFEQGVRNSMGFDWDPATHILWFTDNGQDMMGDDLPPDELNRAPGPHMNFGFPYFYGDNIPAPHYKGLKSAKGMTPPILDLPAHAAALGMTFYHNDILIALHGSWNRSKKIGYEVVRVHREGEKIKGFETFISGWLEKDGQVWGRPVDVLVMPDGSVLISDDMAGVIYRVYKA